MQIEDRRKQRGSGSIQLAPGVADSISPAAGSFLGSDLNYRMVYTKTRGPARGYMERAKENQNETSVELVTTILRDPSGLKGKQNKIRVELVTTILPGPSGVTGKQNKIRIELVTTILRGPSGIK
ncbi:hypothetical protein J6590_054218 [Homalodisca vitripennis]|nr:hypothetical protein J6590_054218 [Homalodisca vitripennis]